LHFHEPKVLHLFLPDLPLPKSQFVSLQVYEDCVLNLALHILPFALAILFFWLQDTDYLVLSLRMRAEPLYRGQLDLAERKTFFENRNSMHGRSIELSTRDVVTVADNLWDVVSN